MISVSPSYLLHVLLFVRYCTLSATAILPQLDVIPSFCVCGYLKTVCNKLIESLRGFQESSCGTKLKGTYLGEK